MSKRHVHHGRLVGGLAAVAAFIAVAVTVPAHASSTDAVIQWNLNSANALSNLPSGNPPGIGMTPPVTAVHLAMVQGAVYDAVNAIDLAGGAGYQPYLSGLPAASASDSVDAAAATAAYDVLVGELNALPLSLQPLVPPVLAWLGTAYNTTLAGIPDGPDKNGGIADGAAAASAMLALRVNDGRYGPFRFTAGQGPGQWRPELPSFVSDPNAWIAKVTPFAMTSQSQFRSDGPQPLKSAAYADEFNEVKSLGAVNSSTRTAEQTALGFFYTDHAVAMWNRTFRTIADQQGLSESAEARLFGMLNLAGADSLIGCWDSKAYWSFWRPITAFARTGMGTRRRRPIRTGFRSSRLRRTRTNRPASTASRVRSCTRRRISSARTRWTSPCTATPRTRTATTRGSRTRGRTRSTPASTSASTSGRPTSTASCWARRSPTGWTSTTSSRSADGQ
jgi:hypothetical protein